MYASVWAKKYLQPKVNEVCGAPIAIIEEFYALYISRFAAENPSQEIRIASIGAGNGDLEVRIGTFLRNSGIRHFRFECMDINPEMLEPRIGVDESGKGDFFGPLVVAGVYVSTEAATELKDKGIKDSGIDVRYFVLAVVLRDIALLVLAGSVVRDILDPRHDTVRAREHP